MLLLSLRPLLAALPFLVAPAGPEAPDLREEEKVLEAAKVPTDGPGLLSYFRDRTPSDAEKLRLATLVRQLGHRSFAVREKASRQLITAGEAALPFLKPALKDADAEVVRRTNECIAEIELVPHAARHVAAARLLAVRRPEGAAEVLLAFLPFADWETIGEQLLDPFLTLGLETKEKDAIPRAAVVAAAKASEPTQRIAAAYVLARAAPAHHRPLTALLDDTDPRVRFYTGAGLLRARDRRSIPALIGLLDGTPSALAWNAEDLLYRVAGEHAPAPIGGSPEDPAIRKKWRAAWEDWWKSKQEKIDLAKISLDEVPLGLTVACEIDGLGQFPGRVTEFDRGGNQRGTIEGLDSPSDLQRLPGGRVLVAEHWAQRVTERDRQGKVLWERKLADKPVSCQRLPNGNTFIATYTELLEVTPDGKTAFSHKETGMIYCACKRRDGNVLSINSSGRVVERNAAGKEVRAFTPSAHASGAAYWASIEPLPGGRYLISLSGSGKVVETDAAGKVLWECSVPSACWATRLPGGNTLVTDVDGRRVVEVDRQGKELWAKTTKGRPFRARRY